MRKINYFYYLFWSGFLMALWFFGWTATWDALVIPTMHPPYADMRTVQSALESIAQGFNPQLENPGDPWGRLMNYPSIWLEIAKLLNLGNEANYLIFISAYILLFIIWCGWFLRENPSIWLLLIFLSGATLLAIERGNNDLVVFLLLALTGFMPRIYAGVMISVATCLKIFPLFALLCTIKSWRHLLLGLLFAIPVLWWLYPELMLIKQATPMSFSLAYGSPSIASGIGFPSVLITLILGVGIFLFFLIKNPLLVFKQPRSNERNIHLFLIGAGVYLGTFIFASNFDYRLIFLIFCVPYIFAFDNRLLKTVLLTSMIIAMNFSLLNVLGLVGLMINVFAKCVVFCGLGVLLVSFLRENGNFKIKFIES